MYANSSTVFSAQSAVHDKLEVVLGKHVHTVFRKPLAPCNEQAFVHAMRAWECAGSAPLILDSGCGVGLSSMNLAVRYADHFVIGVDQSAHRLERNTYWHGPLPPNYICVRAELVDFWRLLQRAGVRLARHYLLYPNPWPKIGQLRRRWHGHPVFPVVPALGGVFECRSNWRIYIEECALALRWLGVPAQTGRYQADVPLTPFERKYRDSGHALWRCTSIC